VEAASTLDNGSRAPDDRAGSAFGSVLMPLRVRLTLWYGSALALVLITFSVVLYVIIARNLRDSVDQSLEETATTAVRSLEERGFLPLVDEDELLSQFPELARIDKFFQIFSPSGTITLRSPNIKQHDVPLSRIALETAFKGQTILESARYPNEPPLRLISVPINYRGRLLYIVQVGTSMESIEDTLHRFLILLIVAVPVALAVSLAAGWFLAGRALRPVDAITLAAQRIARGDLSQRLTMPPAKDEIGRLAGTFNNMIGRLDASFRQIRQFTSDASHELRTPLTVMKGETELVLRRPRPLEDYRSVLESNLEEIDRMSRIVEELLFLSRADMGEVKMEALPVALESLVEDIHRQATLLGQDRQIEVVLGTVMPALVQGDELRLRELLLNLVENAVKYSHPSGKVQISLVTDGRQAILSVTDQGIGIALEDRSQIFSRFFRAAAARSHTKKGTGLGLAICAWIVESHKGRINVESEVGRGSTFTVTLPLAQRLA
jgi:two-component system OmpR family sensor kinase